MKHDTEACLLCLTPQCLLFVLCFAISRWKRIILCFQLIFLYCAQRPPKPAAHCHTGRLRWRGKLLLTYPHLPPPNHSSCKASVFLHSNMLMPVLSPPMKPASVMMPALAPAVTFQRLFSSVFLLFFFLLMFMLVFFEVEGADGLQSISLVHK